jgi:hypothetical protein
LFESVFFSESNLALNIFIALRAAAMIKRPNGAKIKAKSKLMKTAFHLIETLTRDEDHSVLFVLES